MVVRSPVPPASQIPPSCTGPAGMSDERTRSSSPVSREQRPQVLVQEQPLRVELPAELDEAVALGVALGELLARQVVQLAPVHAGAERPEQLVDGEEVVPVVGARPAGD